MFDGKVPARFKSVVERYSKLLDKEFVYDKRIDNKMLSFWNSEDGESSGVDFHYYMQMHWPGMEGESRMDRAIVILTHRVDDSTGEWDRLGTYVAGNWLAPNDFGGETLMDLGRMSPMDPAKVMEHTKSQLVNLSLPLFKKGADVDPERFAKLPGWKDWTTKVHMVDGHTLRVVMRPKHAGKDTADRLVQDAAALARADYGSYSLHALQDLKKRTVLFVFSPKKGGEFHELDAVLDNLALTMDLSDKQRERYRRQLTETHLLRFPSEGQRRTRRRSGAKVEPTAVVDEPAPEPKEEPPCRQAEARHQAEGGTEAQASAEDSHQAQDRTQAQAE